MSTLRQIAFRAARLAGQSLLKNYQRLKKGDIYKKGKHDLVTKADFDANNIIIKTIRKNFPSHNFFSEETGLENDSDAYRWVIDPLDGTLNYRIKSPLFCTALALIYRGKIILSVIYAPLLKELYYAEQGRGAFLNDKKIRVSTTASLIEAVVLLGRSHHTRSHINYVKLERVLDGRAMNTRHFGSGSINFAYVAAGRADACLLIPPGLSIWDTAPGVLLVQEAGGRVSDWRGQPWNLSRQGVIATNSLVHKQLARLIKK